MSSMAKVRPLVRKQQGYVGTLRKPKCEASVVIKMDGNQRSADGIKIISRVARSSYA